MLAERVGGQIIRSFGKCFYVLSLHNHIYHVPYTDNTWHMVISKIFTQLVFISQCSQHNERLSVSV